MAAEINKIKMFRSTSCLYSTVLQIDIKTKLNGTKILPKRVTLEQSTINWLYEFHKFKQGINNLKDSVKHPIKKSEK